MSGRPGCHINHDRSDASQKSSFREAVWLPVRRAIDRRARAGLGVSTGPGERQNSSELGTAEEALGSFRKRDD